MALKGFLASGFQKLIGASRIKGANDKFLGEFNQSSFSTSTFPLVADIQPGFNFIKYTGTVQLNYTSGALFSPTPTSEAVVLFQNLSSSGSGVTLNSNITTGGLSLTGGQDIMRAGDIILLVYDTVNTRWREITRTPWGVEAKSLVVNSSGGLNIQTNGKDVFVTVDRSGTSDLTITGVTGYYTIPTSIGTRLTISGKYNLDMSYSIIFQQYTGLTGPTTFSKLLINGDFVLTPNSTLTLIQTEAGWVEVSRSNPTY